jgi:hypothetical protein
MLKAVLSLAFLTALIHSSMADQRSLEINLPGQFVPKVLRDSRTGMIFYLESDRHHLSAISRAGKLIWQIDTWVMFRSKTEQLRASGLVDFIDFCKSDYYVKVFLKPKQHLSDEDFLTVHFNSDAFGLINKSNGEFVFEGQD